MEGGRYGGTSGYVAIGEDQRVGSDGITYGDAQKLAHEQAIANAKLGQQHFASSLRGDFLDGSDQLDAALAALRGERARNFQENFLPELAAITQSGGAYNNANLQDVTDQSLQRFNDPYDEALTRLRYEDYVRERGAQDRALAGLQQAHAIENVIHDARQQDAQQATRADLSADFSVAHAYQQFLNNTGLKGQRNESTTTQTTKTRSSPLQAAMRVGAIAAGVMTGNPALVSAGLGGFGGGGVGESIVGATSPGGWSPLHRLKDVLDPRTSGRELAAGVGFRGR